MTESWRGGVVFDRAAIIDWAFQKPYSLAVGFAVVKVGDTLVVPATALAEARAHVPPDRLDVLEVLLDLPNTMIVALDRASHVPVAGVLAGSPGTVDALSSAHVVAESVGREFPCLTDRGPQLQGLDPRIIVDELP
ncbi:hypothetical protein HLB23_04065 [Nocardia uniformis]|uniref:Uncharacterized protein n=1 Tax=Nocardia uniformis TaxID=53432 RepID=A0A849BSE8_9NOCA|nr:hypothetical protein [Nocardia uniformis]NNH69054.1 hypothetical protein [Nocardia uniformis]